MINSPPLPLSGKRIINTRTQSQAAELTDLLAVRGAEVLELPTIEIVPAGAGTALEREIADLDNFNWLVFTSINSVEIFLDRVIALRQDLQVLRNVKIASIGPGTTRALAGFGVTPELIAQDSSGEGLSAVLKNSGAWSGVRVLFPRAEKARDIVPDTLNALGADLVVVTAYRTVAPQHSDPGLVREIIEGQYDCCTFSSASTFENLVNIIGLFTFSRIAGSFKAASIGPSTSKAIRKAGVEPILEAEKHTLQGLVDAIELYFMSVSKKPDR